MLKKKRALFLLLFGFINFIAYANTPLTRETIEILGDSYSIGQITRYQPEVGNNQKYLQKYISLYSWRVPFVDYLRYDLTHNNNFNCDDLAFIGKVSILNDNNQAEESSNKTFNTPISLCKSDSADYSKVEATQIPLTAWGGYAILSKYHPSGENNKEDHGAMNEINHNSGGLGDPYATPAELPEQTNGGYYVLDENNHLAPAIATYKPHYLIEFLGENDFVVGDYQGSQQYTADPNCVLPFLMSDTRDFHDCINNTFLPFFNKVAASPATKVEGLVAAMQSYSTVQNPSYIFFVTPIGISNVGGNSPDIILQARKFLSGITNESELSKFNVGKASVQESALAAAIFKPDNYTLCKTQENKCHLSYQLFPHGKLYGNDDQSTSGAITLRIGNVIIVQVDLWHYIRAYSLDDKVQDATEWSKGVSSLTKYRLPATKEIHIYPGNQTIIVRCFFGKNNGTDDQFYHFPSSAGQTTCYGRPAEDGVSGLTTCSSNEMAYVHPRTLPVADLQASSGIFSKSLQDDQYDGCWAAVGRYIAYVFSQSISPNV